MRLIFIFAGIELIHKFHSLIYVFRWFLIFTGVRMITSGDKKLHLDKNPLVILVRKIFPVTTDFEGDIFFVNRGNVKWMTPQL
jgi:tellurite resistance protein TerC